MTNRSLLGGKLGRTSSRRKEPEKLEFVAFLTLGSVLRDDAKTEADAAKANKVTSLLILCLITERSEHRMGSESGANI